MSFTKSGDTAGNPLVIGNTAKGSAVINGGTSASLLSVVAGFNESGTGSLLVTGSGSQLNVSSPWSYIRIGDYGKGEMTVSGGATVTLWSPTKANFSIGSGADGTGSVTVTGAGSQIKVSDTSGGNTIVGGGTGGAELVITSGASFVNSANRFMLVGGWDPSIRAPGGSVIIDGNGNTATLLDAGNTITIGNVNSGTVSVLDKGTLKAHIISVTGLGALSGNGYVSGEVSVAKGGNVSPAKSGTLQIDGPLTITGGTIDAVAASDGDTGHISATGAVSLNGFNVAVSEVAQDFTAGRHLLIHSDSDLAIGAGAVTVEPDASAARDAFVLRDEGKNLTLEVIDGSRHPAIVDLGAMGLAQVTLSVDGGSGEISGANPIFFFNAGVVKGTSGADELTGHSSAEHLDGSDGDDVLSGGGGNDLLYGGRGNDTISGGTKSDKLFGGAGNDTLYAGTDFGAKDILNGGSGNDVIHGSARATVYKGDADTLMGGSGNDIITDISGGDRIDGGSGRDTLVLSDARFSLFSYTIDLKAGTGLLESSETTTEKLTITGIENVTGSSLPDFNSIVVIGSDAANVLVGGSWYDSLQGGLGADRLTGGGSGDSFVYAQAEDSVANGAHDTITDFTSGADKLDLSAIDAQASHNGNDAFVLTGNNGQDSFVAGVEGQIRIEQTGSLTIIWADLNGDTVADMQIDLQGTVTLTSTDFVL